LGRFVGVKALQGIEIGFNRRFFVIR
jgi:hypothetical protein